MAQRFVAALVVDFMIFTVTACHTVESTERGDGKSREDIA